MQPFVHLCVRSEFNMDSTVKIHALMSKCQQENMPAVALTDENTLHYIVDFIENSRNSKVKAIFGSEFTIRNDEGVEQKVYALARTNQGYENVIKLSSLSFSKPDKGVYITPNELDRFQKDIFMLVDDEPMFVYDKKQLYVRLRFDVSTHAASAAIASKIGAELIAADTVTHLFEQDGKLQHVLKSAAESTKLTLPEDNGHYFKTAEEMNQIYHNYPQALANTLVIAQACEVTIALKGDQDFKRMLPRFPIPEDVVVPDNIWSLSLIHI